MAEDLQQFLRTPDNVFSDFPDDFKIYVQMKELLCHRGYFNRGWVFSNPQADCCESPPLPPPPPPFSVEIIDLELETSVAANRDLVGKIKSIITWMVSSPGRFLVQFWKPIEIGGRRLLTTGDQPFGVSTTEHGGLCSYRLTSLKYQFDVDGESEEELGLLGRVFRHQQPESTPNVWHYSCKEYPQRNHAVANNIGGALILPVLESSGGRRCVGVLEFVTAAKGNYCLREIKKWIRKDFTFVDLKYPETCKQLCYKPTLYKDEAFEAALVEVKELLKLVCTTHYLPLAQIWILCSFCHPVVDSGGSFNASCRGHLVAEMDTCFHMQKDKFPFSHACSLHTLQKGQGVVGRAFSSHNLVFCKDVTQFSITEYPLAHYARECRFTGCFAICLRESYNGYNVIVLEFFLPPSNTEGGGDWRIILDSVLETMRQHLKSFKLASGEELGDALSVEVIDHKLDSFQTPQIARSPDRIENGWEMVPLGLSYQQLIKVDSIDIVGNNNLVVSNTEKNKVVVTSTLQKCITSSSPRQCRRAGIPISFEDIQQRFGMKLDDAAESLGVSRSTLKRVCREYDISWWSARKRNKDNNSLSNKFLQGAAEDQIRESSQTPISDPPRNQELVTAARTETQFMEAQDTSIVTIKAKYGDNFIKFQFSALSRMVEFQQEVAKRLNWKAETYDVKYQDDDNDWILISCDEDLRYHICNSRLLGRNPVTLSLQPITNCPTLISC